MFQKQKCTPSFGFIVEERALIIRFFNFYHIPTNAKVPMPPPSGKTFIPKIEALRAMFNVADLKGKVVLSLGSDLAWRLGDFINLKKSEARAHVKTDFWRYLYF